MRNLNEIIKENGTTFEEVELARRPLVEGVMECPVCKQKVLYGVIDASDFVHGPPYSTLRCVRCAREGV